MHRESRPQEATNARRWKHIASPDFASTRRSDDGDAFIHDPQGGPAHTRDELAETLAEEFLSSATSAQEVTEDRRDEITSEELGGPFVQANGSEEFASTTDDMNPEDADREPFPTAMRSS